ncbi:MAG: hypothetical protein I3273_07150 [Candidatus Moeniiplasma glomeromycotorum]|nr:hypothetical protein [Candidatus Moeniiplasma glomeromycotorum]MCE8168383.1 hypothetical protein [Candidatus Moeniiplasma glomeromycotorum]MCE8169863.1 hypothetical protein [Candidatus Moeniiplasma glomeromycotorum]
MTKLLNLTIKINGKTKYRNDPKNDKDQIIELAGPIEIKDQSGKIVSQIKEKKYGSKYLVKNIKFIKLSSFSGRLDVPISWAWENRKTDTEIQFTLKKLKYDETNGLSVKYSEPDSSPKNLDTLILYPNSCEVEELKIQGESYSLYWKMIELNVKNEASTFTDFMELREKLWKAGGDEQIANWAPTEIEKWKNATPDFLAGDEEYRFYNLENIIDNKKVVKEFCDFWLKKIGDLKEWKKKGIKNLVEAEIAEENGFNITEPGLASKISSDGKYRGFPIANNQEKHQILVSESNKSLPNSNESYRVESKNRYTKFKIDCFRDCFPNDPNQTEPQYFRGFRVGDIGKINESFASTYHQKDIESKRGAAYLIEKDYTRTYYEFRSYFELDENFQPWKLLKIILRKESFNEIQAKQQKTKKECLDIY